MGSWSELVPGYELPPLLQYCPVVQKVIRARIRGFRVSQQVHPSFGRGMPGFPSIARGAGADDVLPTVPAILAAGFHMIQGKIFSLEATILAHIPITQEDFFFGKLAF